MKSASGIKYIKILLKIVGRVGFSSYIYWWLSRSVHTAVRNVALVHCNSIDNHQLKWTI